MKLLILLLISFTFSVSSEQMYIHIRGNSKENCTAVLKQITFNCTGNAGHSNFILGTSRVGMVNSRVIKNNTLRPTKTTLGWAYEIDKEIVVEWGSRIENFIINNPTQVADTDWYTIAQVQKILPEATNE